ncbi:hypothetical protein ACEQ8H_006368 [Pleosporales sp. CAS-2024a]
MAFRFPELHPPHYPVAFHHVPSPYTHSAAAEWCPQRRLWVQDGRQLRHVKASKAFLWPKDGRNGSAWGRLKDIVQNKGPDVFVTLNANKRDYMQNRPSKHRWAARPELDYTLAPTHLSSRRNAAWTKKRSLGGRTSGLEYDFRTRKYGRLNWASWTDAVWQPEPLKNKENPYPEAYRDVEGEWWQDRHYCQWGEGHLSNEQGVGNPLYPAVRG